MPNPSAIYKDRIKEFISQETAFTALHKRYSIGRLILFVLCIAVVIVLFQQHWVLGIIAIYCSIMVFYYLVKRHNKISRQLTIATRLKTINQWELDALDHNFSAYSSGEQFMNEKHPFVNDLDIFGKNSLFQYSNRCQTSFGDHQLSDFYLNGVNKDALINHQAALLELEQLIDWRQEYFAICQSDLSLKTLNKDFIKWVNQDSGITFRSSMFVLIPLLSCILLFVLIRYLPMLSYFIAFIPAGLFAMRHSEKITQFQATASTHSNTLKQYAEAIQWIESKTLSTHCSQTNKICCQRKSLLLPQKSKNCPTSFISWICAVISLV